MSGDVLSALIVFVAFTWFTLGWVARPVIGRWRQRRADDVRAARGNLRAGRWDQS